jgi:Fe2+ transport system protein B
MPSSKIIDTPGVNSLDRAISEDECITRDLVTSDQADLVIQSGGASPVRP